MRVENGCGVLQGGDVCKLAVIVCSGVCLLPECAQWTMWF